MSVFSKLGGRHKLLGNPWLRTIARGAVRINLGSLGDVSSSFRGVFKVRGPGVSFDYELAAQDTIGEILYWQGLGKFERDTVPLFVDLARKARGVLDIGSNTGVYTLLACGSNRDSRVFAWEPVHHLAGKLRANISLNGFDSRCVVREAAVADRNGDVDFFLSDDTTMSSLSKNYAEDNSHTSTKTTVKVERIDTVLPAGFIADLIKIDVEGHEFEALLGASEVLRGSHPKIIFECLPTTNPEPIEKLLREMGYSIFRLSEENKPQAISAIIAEGLGHNFLASV